MVNRRVMEGGTREALSTAKIRVISREVAPGPISVGWSKVDGEGTLELEVQGRWCTGEGTLELE